MVNRVFLIGYMGSGKTTIGKHLARDLGWNFIDMDNYFEEKEGCSISDYFAAHGEAGFREAEHQVVLELAHANNAVISAGGGAPCFFDNIDIMRHSGLVIYLDVAVADLVRRLKGQCANRPLLAGKTDNEMAEVVANALKQREPFYRRAHMSVDGEHLPFSMYKGLVDMFPEEELRPLKAALFDFDGVVMDTERYYTKFWGSVGAKYHPEIENFASLVKGSTLKQIYDNYFSDSEELRNALTQELNDFEARGMTYEYVSGAHDYIMQLRRSGVKTALVTSSNEQKMRAVYASHPEVKEMFDVIITADLISRSKPDPECYLLAAELLGENPNECTVYEDSIAGLQAGRAAGMHVVGLSGTHGRKVVEQYADEVIADFVFGC